MLKLKLMEHAMSVTEMLYFVLFYRDRLLVGLSRLSEANSLVGAMQEELVALGPKIEEKARVSQEYHI